MRALTTEPLNAAPDLADLDAPRTPVERFFVRNHAPAPPAAPDHVVVVRGLVEHDLVLSRDDLRALPRAEVIATLQCAGNRRAELIARRPIDGEIPWGPSAIGTAAWGGVRLRDVLARAGVTDTGRHVAFLGGDDVRAHGVRGGFGGSIPIEKAMGDEVVLADTMNGAPLTADHGAPLRAVVPGYVGARSVKWLAAVEVRTDPTDNPFQDAYSLFREAADPVVLGEMPVNAAIRSPGGGDVVRAGTVVVGGYALTGNGSGIATVEVSADDGRSWTPAALLGEDLPWAWRLWRAEVRLGPGEHVVVCRARDGAGRGQPEHLADVWNRKGYANNAWHRVPVRVL